jgi:hypothetical protein
MAVQEDSCWRCGAAWACEIDWIPEVQPTPTLRLIKGGAADAVPPQSTAARLARLRAEARR